MIMMGKFSSTGTILVSVAMYFANRGKYRFVSAAYISQLQGRSQRCLETSDSS